MRRFFCLKLVMNYSNRLTPHRVGIMKNAAICTSSHNNIINIISLWSSTPSCLSLLLSLCLSLPSTSEGGFVFCSDGFSSHYSPCFGSARLSLCGGHRFPLTLTKGSLLLHTHKVPAFLLSLCIVAGGKHSCCLLLFTDRWRLGLVKRELWTTANIMNCLG